MSNAAAIEPLLLDYHAAAQALSLTRSALRDLLYRSAGPDYVKLGSRTFFRPEDLRAWVASRPTFSQRRMPANDPRPVAEATPPAKRKPGRPRKYKSATEETRA